MFAIRYERDPDNGGPAKLKVSQVSLEAVSLIQLLPVMIPVHFGASGPRMIELLPPDSWIMISS